ncbi:hypothetical protein SAMN05421578_10865 [Paenibacillus macquariensis]|uniref:Uncharacterized protein n=1 Tax=Paenibacillus macquariensis TaxID=948756 RepID=A0ABY1K2V6_9BACL|nr:hypothetical protein SAMN05421578_10865 [Paenibacillus macquariensis]
MSQFTSDLLHALVTKQDIVYLKMNFFKIIDNHCR